VSLTQSGIDGDVAKQANAMPEAIIGRSVSEGWRQALFALAVAIIGLCAVFWGTVSQMVETWYVSATFNHGFMIVPICLWLVWDRREAIEKYMPKPDFRGLLVIAACMVAWTVASAAGVQSGMQFALVGMIQGAVFTVLGWRLVRAMFFPLGFLFFAVPFGDFLIPTLQDLTAVMVVEGLRLISIPVYIDGVFLSIPTGNFEVAEACSGVRFLIATVALGTLFANLSFRTSLRRSIIIFLAIVVPLVANGIRAFGIVYIAHVTDHTVAVGVDHLVYGWIFFAFVTIVLLAIGMTFRETDGDNTIYMPADEDRQPGRYSTPKGMVAGAAASLAVAFVGPAYAGVMLDHGISKIAAPLAAPSAGNGWQAVGRSTTTWRPKFAGADAELMTSFRKSTTDLHMYLAYYTHQRQGAELVNSANTFIDGVNWQRASSGFSKIQVGGQEQTVKETRLLGRKQGRLVWEFYWIGGHFTADRYEAKAYEAVAKLLGTNQAAAAIVVAADYHDSPADAARILQDFMANLGNLNDALKKTTK
jgi:exosortase A